MDINLVNFEVDKKESAIIEIEEGIKKLPECADLRYRLTAYLLSLGNKNHAYEQFSHALKLDYEKHKDLFDFLPQSKKNTAIIDLISSFEK